MSNKQTMVEKTQQQKEEQKLSESAIHNLEAIEEEIETSTQYFKPRPDKLYLVSFNPEEKIEVRLNERFRTADGKPTVRYEMKMTHVNNGKQQLWETSKTLCTQIISELKKGYRVLKVQRFGEARGTVYKIEAVQ